MKSFALITTLALVATLFVGCKPQPIACTNAAGTFGCSWNGITLGVSEATILADLTAIASGQKIDVTAVSCSLIPNSNPLEMACNAGPISATIVVPDVASVTGVAVTNSKATVSANATVTTWGQVKGLFGKK